MADHPFQYDSVSILMVVHIHVLYYFILGTQDYLCSLDLHDLAESEDYVECPDPPASLEFLAMVNVLFQDHQLQPVFPHTIIELYVQLFAIIEAEID